MSKKQEKTDLERAQELFDLLQGTIPDGCQVKNWGIPHLTPNQAYTVIWWLGNEHAAISDRIERCDMCGDLYDGTESGWCLDFGKSPIFFCDACESTPEFEKKYRKAKKKGLI